MADEKQRSWKDMIPEMLDEYREKITDQMVQEMGPGADTGEVPHARELELFWHTKMPPEQQQALWLDPNMTPEQFSRTVYPTRWDMMSGDGRVTEEQQAKWAAKMAAQPRPPSKMQPQETTEPTQALPSMSTVPPMGEPSEPVGY